MSGRWWKVVYTDGTERVRGEIDYFSIDRDRLKKFQLLGENGDKVLFELELGKDRELIFRRRVTMLLDGTIIRVRYLVGYVDSGGTATIYYVDEQGNVEFKKEVPWTEVDFDYTDEERRRIERNIGAGG